MEIIERLLKAVNAPEYLTAAAGLVFTGLLMFVSRKASASAERRKAEADLKDAENADEEIALKRLDLVDRSTINYIERIEKDNTRLRCLLEKSETQLREEHRLKHEAKGQAQLYLAMLHLNKINPKKVLEELRSVDINGSVTLDQPRNS